MTLIEAINGIYALKPSAGYDKSQMVQWLSQLDGMVHNEIYRKFADSDDTEFVGYTDNTPGDTKLLIPHPYDMIYAHWLAMQIDYHNQESTYLASQTMFNTAYVAFEKWYFSAHRPKSRQYKYY